MRENRWHIPEKVETMFTAMEELRLTKTRRASPVASARVRHLPSGLLVEATRALFLSLAFCSPCHSMDGDLL